MMIWPHSPPCGKSARKGSGPHISYLLTTRVDFGSVKHRTAVNNNDDGSAMLYRSEIDHNNAEISLLYLKVPFRRCWPRSCHVDLDRWKVVPRGEIFINPSDPKHVA